VRVQVVRQVISIYQIKADILEQGKHIKDPEILQGSAKAHELGRNYEKTVREATATKGDNAASDSFNIFLIDSVGHHQESYQVREDRRNKNVDDLNFLFQAEGP
jgi:hypothetical protein